MKEARWFRDFSAVCVKGEIYLFSGNVGKKVEKLSLDSNAWEYATGMIDGRIQFSACSLMDSIFIIGGRKGKNMDGRDIATCFEFVTKSFKWKQLSSMGNARRASACSVFEGRIVVSGGSNNFRSLNAVEAYDHVGDAWENMPSMIHKRFHHKSVAVKNKLFVIGGHSTSNCEVFDSTTNKFTLLNQPTLAPNILQHLSGLITIGSKLFVFRNKGYVTIYDSKNDEWLEKTTEATKNLLCFSCASIPVRTC